MESNRCRKFQRPSINWPQIASNSTYGFAYGCEGFEGLPTFGGWLFSPNTCVNMCIFFSSSRRYSPTGPSAASLLRSLYHTQVNTHTHTPGRTPLYQWSARRRGRYLQTQNIHKRRTWYPQRDSNPRPQTHALHCTATENQHLCPYLGVI